MSFPAPPTKAVSLRRRTRYSPALFVVMLYGMVAMPAQGFFAVVTNPTALFQSATQFAEQLAQWQETIEHYQKTLQHYADQAQFWTTQINKLRQLRFATFAARHTFSRIPEDFGVDVECPGAASGGGFGNVLNSALSTLTPNIDGDVLAQQRDLCVQIVRAKNAKYNYTVDYLDFVKEKTDEILRVQNNLVTKIGTSLGNTQGVTQQLTEFGKTLDVARSSWESNMQQTDIHINMLMTMQGSLSRRALQGSPSPLGSLVNTVALKAALKR
ncbi:hypothetical protein P3W24_07140 [Luteibacter sp. PPL201]|uniref:P-type conjugative transfer protein TrbJ n=1 Tax=Luteibacter sahnii TaxID=3021977 RepID=A0ABT6BBU7_9GAMM